MQDKIITNPISSNDVVEVGIPKSKCATFCGNSLNDWLKWLAEDKCVDWTSIDTTCLRDFLEDGDTSDQDLLKIIELLVDTVCVLTTEIDQLTCCDTTSVVLDLQNEWISDYGAPKAVKKGGVVYLTGLITNGTSTIAQLPVGYRPNRTVFVPVAATDDGFVGWLLIDDTGYISFQGGSYSGYISLECSFLISA